MTLARIQLLFVTSAILACAGCNQQPAASNAVDNVGTPNAAATDTPAKSGEPIASAMSVASGSIAGNATIVMANADGSMKTLREGKNGWACMPDSPSTPGPDPMCMDANAAKWAAAWMGHKAQYHRDDLHA